MGIEGFMNISEKSPVHEKKSEHNRISKHYEMEVLISTADLSG